MNMINMALLAAGALWGIAVLTIPASALYGFLMALKRVNSGMSVEDEERWIRRQWGFNAIGSVFRICFYAGGILLGASAVASVIQFIFG